MKYHDKILEATRKIRKELNIQVYKITYAEERLSGNNRYRPEHFEEDAAFYYLEKKEELVKLV